MAKGGTGLSSLFGGGTQGASKATKERKGGTGLSSLFGGGTQGAGKAAEEREATKERKGGTGLSALLGGGSQSTPRRGEADDGQVCPLPVFYHRKILFICMDGGTSLVRSTSVM
jgi:hypothetical protein